MRRDQGGRPGRASLGHTILRELILYVEDDDDNWDIAVLRLGKSFELIRARTDQEACQLVRERRGEIDAILMDIELRGSELNGVELTELMRGNSLPQRSLLPAYARNLPAVSTPVIFVTAHGARFTRVQLMLSGADKVLSKPVDFAELKAVLAEAIQERSRG